jgi:hypothetical protein
MFCIDVIKFTARREIFTVRQEKSLAVRELVRDTYQAIGAKRQTLYFLTIKIKSKFLKLKFKIKNFKILQQIIRKFPAIQ